MVDIDKYEHGVPSWVDVSCPDLERGRQFYGALFGWDVPPGPDEAGGYSVALLRARCAASARR